MSDPIRTLSELTRSRHWPDRWMTLKEIDSELVEQGFWERVRLTGWSEEGRLDWLRKTLTAEEKTWGGRATWLRIGGRYKHFALVLQNKVDVNAYLDWVAEVRQARFRHAEDLVNGEVGVVAVKLHPLGPSPEECVGRAEEFAREVIALLPDEVIAQRVQKIWDGYQTSRPADPLACLRVCRLIFAVATLFIEALRSRGVVLAKDAPTPLRRLWGVACEAESWLSSLYCSPAVGAPEVAETEIR